jgi:hypothetical protein
MEYMNEVMRESETRFSENEIKVLEDSSRLLPTSDAGNHPEQKIPAQLIGIWKKRNTRFRIY